MTMPATRRGFAFPFGFVISIVLLLGATVDAARADASDGSEELAVFLDQARLVRLPERVSTIVIGNPLIADASIQSRGLMVITGKGYGTTNIVALDRDGAPLMERRIVVHGPDNNIVVVYRGVRRETYSCSPFCNPRVTLGDDPVFFRQRLSETGSWNGQVQGAAQLGRR